jgi:hypothetical protein
LQKLHAQKLKDHNQWTFGADALLVLDSWASLDEMQKVSLIQESAAAQSHL